MDFKTADLYDRYEEALRVCDPLFRDFGGHRPLLPAPSSPSNASRTTRSSNRPWPSRVTGASWSSMPADRCAAPCWATSSPPARSSRAGPASCSSAACATASRSAQMPLGVKALASNPAQEPATRRGPARHPRDLRGYALRARRLGLLRRGRHPGRRAVARSHGLTPDQGVVAASAALRSPDTQRRRSPAQREPATRPHLDTRLLTGAGCPRAASEPRPLPPAPAPAGKAGLLTPTMRGDR